MTAADTGQGDTSDGDGEHLSAFGGSGFDPTRWQSDDFDTPADGGDDDWMPSEDAAPLEDEESVAELESAAGDFASPAASEVAVPSHGAEVAGDPAGDSAAGSAGEPRDGGAPAPIPPGAPTADSAAGVESAAGEAAQEYPSFELPREEPRAEPRRAPQARSGGRITPHDLSAEKSVIGGLLISPDRIVEVSEICKPEDLYDRRNRILLEMMIRLDAKGHVVDPLTLLANLRAVGELAEIGGAGYLAEVSASVATSAHIKHHAALVAETSKLRCLIEASGDIIEKAFETAPDAEDVQTLIDESEAAIFGIASKGEARGAAKVSSILEDVFHSIEAQRTRGEFTGIPSGFYDLDEVLGGFNPGEMTVIAARPAMGKTAFVLNLMDHAATNRAECLGYEPSVLFFSLEMGRTSIVQRMLVARAGIEAHRLRQGRLHDREFQDLVEAAGVLKNARLFIDDTPGLSIMALRSRSRRIKAEHGLDMIVIDYLQLLSAKAESRQQEISVISRSLKELSRELEVPLITLAQLSRSVEQREEKRPQLSDLRESGSIEQDADVVMMLYRAEYYFPIDENKGKAEAIIVKHRNGSTGTVELGFQGAMLRFSNREPSMAEPITGL